MEKLRVFVSSKTKELHDERVTIRDALSDVNIDTFIFEKHAGARTESSQQVFLDEVSACDIYIGIFRSEYSAATEQEYRRARATGKEILIYVSDYNAEKRDDRLKRLIAEFQQSHSIEKFEDIKQIESFVKRDITALLVRRFKELQRNKTDVQSTTNTLCDPSSVQRYLEVMAAKTPASLGEAYPVASEIMAVWKAMGYEIKKTEIQESAIDFETEIKHWAGDKKAIIRCVDGELTVQDVEHIKKFLRENNEYQGFVFTFNRISQSARMIANGTPIVTVQTQAEFYRRLMNPEKYINFILNSYSNGDIPKYYVNLDCYKEHYDEENSVFRKESFGDLESYVDKWLLDKTKKHISILGEFGTGKTWFCWKYAYKSMQAYLENPDINRLPIFISLRDYSKSYSIQQMITDLLVNAYEFTSTGAFRVFEELNRQGKFLLIFDGFDEMAQKVDYSVVVNNFWELAKVAVPNSKVLLTCRTTHFRYALESQKVLSGKERGGTILPTNKTGFEILHLEEFSEDKIVEVMAKRIGDADRAREYWDKLKPVYDIPSIAHKPVLIPMLIEVMEDIVKSPKVNPAMIYHIYTDRWIDKTLQEQRGFLKSRWDKLFFTTELAWHMIRTQNLKIYWKDIPSFLNEYFQIPSKEVYYYDHDLRNNSFLRRDHEGVFEFTHKSMAEFFVAYKFALELGAIKQEYTKGIPGEKTKQRTIAQVAETFGHALLTPEISLFLQDMIVNKEILRDLFAKCRQTSENSAFVGSNLMTLLLTMGQSFNTQDLSRMNIPGAELMGCKITNCTLDGANLSKCNMKNALLKGSKINRCNFTGTNLVNANLSDTIGEEVNFSACNASESEFSHTELRGSIISNCNFEDAEFTSAHLAEINAKSTDFSGANLSDADFSNSTIEDCIFDNCNLNGTNFMRSKILKCQFHNIDPSAHPKFGESDLSESILDNIIITKGKLLNMKLNGTSLIGADLSGSRFTGSDLSSCNLHKANLSRCDLAGVKMDGAILREANLTDSHLEGAILSGVDMQYIKADTIHLDEKTNFHGAKIDEKTFHDLPPKFRDLLIRDNPSYGEFLKHPKYRKYDELNT